MGGRYRSNLSNDAVCFQSPAPRSRNQPSTAPGNAWSAARPQVPPPKPDACEQLWTAWLTTPPPHRARLGMTKRRPPREPESRRPGARATISTEQKLIHGQDSLCGLPLKIRDRSSLHGCNGRLLRIQPLISKLAGLWPIHATIIPTASLHRRTIKCQRPSPARRSRTTPDQSDRHLPCAAAPSRRSLDWLTTSHRTPGEMRERAQPIC